MDARAEDDMPLFNTGFENGDSVINIFKKNGGEADAFLHREDYIPVRGTTVLPYECNYLNGNPDIDGIVIEWNDITQCSLECTHLQIIPKGVPDLKNCYSVLRKHLQLQNYSTVAIAMLRESYAAQIFYTNGWESWWGFIPKNDCKTRYEKDAIRNLSIQAMVEMRYIFQRKVKERILGGRILNTGAKNNLNDLSRMFVLPDDRPEVLQILQSAMNDTNLGLGEFRKILITFRFGEKRQTDLPLPFVESYAVVRISVHIGLSFSFDFTEERVSHLLWCKEGIQTLVGERGILTPSLSFIECANYQSNLDGRCLSIKPQLRNVCQYPEQLTFIQFYTDVPHRYPKTRVHPVSAAQIVMKGLLKNRSHLEKDAKTYIEEVENNIEQMVQCKTRLELVCAIPTECKLVAPSKIIHKDQVLALLMKYPLLSPFIHRDFLPVIKTLGEYLVSQLKINLAKGNGSGESNGVWECFQTELALEKFLWGRPLCHKSNIYSVNLGPGLQWPSRSRTDAMGFLCLDSSSACCEDDYTTPPLTVYTSSECLQKQIKKVFGIINLADTGDVVLGRKLIHIFLKDLYDVGNVFERFEEFQMRLKSNPGPKTKVIGGKTKQQISVMMTNAKKAKYPMVIVHLIRKLKDHNVDINQAVVKGIEALQLHFFPALRLYDEQKNAALNWKWSFGLWIITDINDQQITLEKKSIMCTALVVSEVEQRKLFHSSAIAAITLPWIRPSIQKLEDLNLNQEELVTTLVFITCIARLMQGLYVDYQALAKLGKNMPVSQFILQVREILSKLSLHNFNKFRLRRLHQSIPYKLIPDKTINTSEPKDTKEDRPLKKDEQERDMCLEPPNEIQEIGDLEMRQNVVIVPSRHVPTNWKSKWSPIELSILGTLSLQVPMLSDKELYSMYQKECASKGISDRPFKAFRCKLKRM